MAELSSDDLILVKMLELIGYKVVDAKRLEALEKLYIACRRKDQANEELVRLSRNGTGDLIDIDALQYTQEMWNDADDDIDEIIAKLEAMENGESAE